jgi:A/G-specific adenine glycosylase
MQLSQKQIHGFQEEIWTFYKEHGRRFPWRDTRDPYHILVSEIMLQQTQTNRVLKKYPEFISKFPDISSLRSSSLESVLRVWQGMGYNRRAVSLKRISDIVYEQHDNKIPNKMEYLLDLPGVGKATASAVLAFAFDEPTVFVETNIRRVYIHFFFSDQDRVTDMEILGLVQQTLDTENPREWYYGLMDFGVMLKKEYPDLIRKSAHYTKQSKFEGSDRQLRGKILRLLLQESPLPVNKLLQQVSTQNSRALKIFNRLEAEGFIEKNDDNYSIV